MFSNQGWVPAQVFIDVPNIVIDRRVPYILDWHKLIAHIGQWAIGPATLHRANAYLIHPLAPESPIGTSFLDALQVLGAQHLKIKEVTLGTKPSERSKDVDTLIVNDIWRSFAHFSRQGARQVRHVLMSGDRDFARTYMHARAEYPDMRIQLIICSWSSNCSPAYARMEGTDILFLDDIPGLVLGQSKHLQAV